MNNRIKRVSRLVKRELSQLLLKEIDFPERILVTITRVETSADLRRARVYISTMPGEKTSEVIRILNYRIFDIQKGLDKRLTMKIVPKISFKEERMTAEAGRIEELLEKIKESR